MSAVHIRVGEADAHLDQRLSDELDGVNATATPGVPPPRELTARAESLDGTLLGGVSGWTWGEAAGIGMLWVDPSMRGTGLGAQLMDAVERQARDRGCQRVFVTSFTFQAPGFYRRRGYEEIGRWEGLPTAGLADVHLVLDLQLQDGGSAAPERGEDPPECRKGLH